MGRASIKGRMRLINRIRNSGLFVNVRGMNEKDAKMAELKKSLEFFIRWKKRISVEYDELFNESEFIKKVRYIYKKTSYAKPQDPEEKVLDYYDHKAEERSVREHVEYEQANGRKKGYKCRPYTPKGKNGGLRFFCDEKHLSLLRRLDIKNKISQQIAKIIVMIRKEIKRLEK